MVALLLADGFETVEALSVPDILRRAGIEILLAGIKTEVVSAHGISVKCDCLLSDIDPERLDMLVLPGGSVGVENLGKDENVLRLVREVYDAGKYIGAICAAPVILAELGILKGVKAVCYPSLTDEIGRLGAFVRDCAVVRDKNIITARAAGSSLEFSLALTAALRGDEAAEEIRKAVCLPTSVG